MNDLIESSAELTALEVAHQSFFEEETLHNVVLCGNFQNFHKSQIAAMFNKSHLSLLFLEVRESQNYTNSAIKNKTEFQGGLLISCKGSKKLLERVLDQSIPCKHKINLWQSIPLSSIWFPRHIKDLGFCRTLWTDREPFLNEDYPGFHDKAYRKRRNYIASLANDYKLGNEIPHVDYTEEETNTWRNIYNGLRMHHKNSACSEYLRNFNRLEEKGIYSSNVIPQLQDVSNHLKSSSGFQLCPVSGLLSARDFLASLAFRVFQCTQYIRHHTSPIFTPEPDCCHELMGHVPMFCDPVFAAFSQEVGLASLGASDEDIEKLATLYWFTVEVGLCKENGKLKIYGAALLSSVGEFEHALSGTPKYLPLKAETTPLQPFHVDSYQPVYFVAENFEDSVAQIRSFSKDHIKRNFSVRYNKKLERAEVIPNKLD